MGKPMIWSLDSWENLLYENQRPKKKKNSEEDEPIQEVEKM